MKKKPHRALHTNLRSRTSDQAERFEWALIKSLEEFDADGREEFLKIATTRIMGTEE
jgi:hypothetical protein